MRAHVQTIAENLERTYQSFRDREFDACIACCDYVISLEPEYWVAEELAKDVRIVRDRNADYYDFLVAKVECWAKLTSTEGEAEVPYQDTLEFPGLRPREELSTEESP